MSKTILITGATSGIGLELAKIYQSEKLILTGRKPLTELNPDLFTPQTYCQADLSREDAHRSIQEFIAAQNIAAIDLLIHNAGMGYYGDWLEQSEESITELLQVNLHAPIALTHSLIPLLTKVNGKVVFISSVAANLPASDYAVYAASKAALSGFARSLRLEHKDMRVQTIFPGATQTPMHKKSGVPEGKLKVESFPSASKVAGQIQQVIESKRSEVTIGLSNKILRGVGRYFAQPLDAIMRRQAS